MLLAASKTALVFSAVHVLSYNHGFLMNLKTFVQELFIKNTVLLRMKKCADVKL